MPTWSQTLTNTDPNSYVVAVFESNISREDNLFQILSQSSCWFLSRPMKEIILGYLPFVSSLNKYTSIHLIQILYHQIPSQQPSSQLHKIVNFHLWHCEFNPPVISVQYYYILHKSVNWKCIWVHKRHWITHSISEENDPVYRDHTVYVND